MKLIPEGLLRKIEPDLNLNVGILDIQLKVEQVVRSQSPIFFPQYTDHGIDHFSNTLKMAYHLVDLDEIDKSAGRKAVVDFLSPLDSYILTSSILLHDLGMHLHFKGFKQLISGFFDDVRVSYFDESTWKKEWENFLIEAKRFSGRDMINIFGSEKIQVTDIDFEKDSIDSEIQRVLIGEFLRRHHGRLAHEIALKGFPVQNEEVVPLAIGIDQDFKNISGLVARSHTMTVRDAMAYVEEIFPADPHFPHGIEIPLIMCVLRVADYFQFDNSRTNSFLIKIKSITSPYSFKEHEAHLATEYFKTDAKDPETLFVDIKPKDGQMFTKLTALFDDIQRELDTSFAVMGEMHGRDKSYLRLRYRRIKTSLRNRKVVSRFPFVPSVFRFEADIDLFKLLVGPLYGHDPAFGVRELVQNSVDACNELAFRSEASYKPLVQIKIEEVEGKKFLFIIDNGKGMSITEIKNYFLKAGASFRNSLEWKVTFEDDLHHSKIRRTGKFGIGVLAAFLIGASIEVTTKRFNEDIGYKFQGSLTNEFIEVIKLNDCFIGTTIKIELTKDACDSLVKNSEKLVQWYIFNTPEIRYSIDGKMVASRPFPIISVKENRQIGSDWVALEIDGFENIVWKYVGSRSQYGSYESKNKFLAVNGILVPQRSYWSEFAAKATEQNKLENYPFVSIIDKNNCIDFELSRNAIRGDLPFVSNLVKSCQLEYLSRLILVDFQFNDKRLQLDGYKKRYRSDRMQKRYFDLNQYRVMELFASDNGFIPVTAFFTPVITKTDKYKVFKSFGFNELKFTTNSICSLFESESAKAKQDITRGEYEEYVAISKREIYHRNLKNSSIREDIRTNLKVIEENNRFVIFKFGNIDDFDTEKLIELYDKNQADAVHLIKQYKFLKSSADGLFKEHFVTPRFIPYDLEDKKDFIKSCSAELQQYMQKKGYITL